MKEKFELEYMISSSEKVLFQRLSTADGLSEWFADNITIQGDIYTFFWDGTKQKAKISAKKENIFIKFQWIDEENKDTYFEFRINTDELTGDVALLITDFAEQEEKEDAIEMWNTQIEELKHAIGL